MSQSLSEETFGTESVSQRVIEAVADETGKEPTEVGPLYHVIDPDALDRLFTPTRGSVRREGRVAFTFGGCDVVVRENGEVEVSERDVLADASEEAGGSAVVFSEDGTAAASRDETA